MKDIAQARRLQQNPAQCRAMHVSNCMKVDELALLFTQQHFDSALRFFIIHREKLKRSKLHNRLA
jgi:hypothetical protein